MQRWRVGTIAWVASTALLACAEPATADQVGDTRTVASSGEADTSALVTEGGDADADADDDDGPDTSGDDAAPDDGVPDPDDSSSETGALDCEIVVELDGQDDAQCGDATAPCQTITHAFGLAEAGCTVRVGPGQYGADTGESFPLLLPDHVQLRGAGSDPAAVHTLIDGRDGNAMQFEVTCDDTPELLRTTLAMHDGLVSDVIVVGQTQPDFVTVLVLEGVAELEHLRVERGQEGIFIAGSADVTIANAFVTEAGHAAIKPAGDSVVEIREATLVANKDAVEPICRAMTTIIDSEAYCNGNGLEALDRATTVLINNDVHHNINGIAARGNSLSISGFGNQIHDNAFGVVDIFGEANFGTADEPGDNILANNRFAGMMLTGVPNVTTAVGNIWQPNVDGADAAGQYATPTLVAGPACGLNNSEVEAPIPSPCDPSTPIVVDASYQNIVLNDGSCTMPPSCGGAMAPCPPLGGIGL